MSKVLSMMIAAAFAGATLTAIAQTAPAPAAKAAAPATPPKASAKAAAKKKPQMSRAELVQCLQPDRRVVVQLSGMTPVPPKPPAKPAADAKPAAAAEAKPAAVADAKPAAAPKPPPPRFTELSANVQGNIAWDPKSPVLKAEGMQELDKLLATVSKGKTTVQAVILTGHSDKLEAGPKNDRSLSEARAKAVAEYLVNKGVDRSMMFWEGRGASQPVPVTKFCFP